MLGHFLNGRLLNWLFNWMLGNIFLYRLHLYTRTDMLLKGICIGKSYLCSSPKAKAKESIEASKQHYCDDGTRDIPPMMRTAYQDGNPDSQ